MPSSPVTPAAARRENLLAVLFIVGATFAAYANTFGVPYLFDDFLSIRDNETIRHWLTAFSPSTGDGITVSGRPLLNFTFALNHALSGNAVWSYHLGNLLIHATAAGVLFGLVRRTLQGSRLAARFGADATGIALVGALVWVLHPLQTESVTYLVQRAESLAGLMYLLTLGCFARAVAPEARRGWFVLAWLSCLLGMAAKETMVTAPVMVLLYDRIFVAESWRELWRRRGRFHLALAATWLLLAALVVSTDGRGGSVGFSGTISVASYALTQFDAIVRYLRLVLSPHPLVLDYGTAVVAGWSAVWWQALLVLALLAASVVAAWRGRPAGYLGLFFFAALAPSSSFVPVVTQTMAEHRMYLALAAVTVLLAIALYQWGGRRGLLWGGGVLALVLGLATVQRNATYRTEIGIWEDTVAKRPDNPRALVILGTLYEKEHRLDEATVLLQAAVGIAPQNSEAWNNLGSVWLMRSDWNQAILCFQRALAIDPKQAAVLSNLGMTLPHVNRVDEAVRQLEAALQLAPDKDNTRVYLAALLLQNQRPAEAAVHFAAYLRRHPEDGATHVIYATLLMALGRGPESLVEFETAVQLRPDDAELHNNYGIALGRAGRVAEALPHFRAAVRLKPDYTEAQQNAEHAARSLQRK